MGASLKGGGSAQQGRSAGWGTGGGSRQAELGSPRRLGGAGGSTVSTEGLGLSWKPGKQGRDRLSRQQAWQEVTAWRALRSWNLGAGRRGGEDREAGAGRGGAVCRGVEPATLLKPCVCTRVCVHVAEGAVLRLARSLS